MKPENGRAPTSARKQTGISQQNPSGTAAFAPQQKSGCTAAIETCSPRHAKIKPGKGWGRPCTVIRTAESNGMDPSPLYGIECQTGVVCIPVNEWGEVEHEAYSGWGRSCEERFSAARRG